MDRNQSHENDCIDSMAGCQATATNEQSFMGQKVVIATLMFIFSFNWSSTACPYGTPLSQTIIFSK